MEKEYTIVLAKRPIQGTDEDWPTDDNISTVYNLHKPLDLYYVANRILESETLCAPWWWIFDGSIDEDNLILSGAIDPEDLVVIEEYFNLF